MGAPLDPTFDTVVTLLRENRCLSRGCHLNNTPSGSNQFAVMSSSDMPTREEIAAGLQGEGNDGPFVVASEPSESRLLDCLRAEGGCSLMPLGGPRLPDREIEAVADWIEQGASYDGE
jgi:hypothetical protein